MLTFISSKKLISPAGPTKLLFSYQRGFFPCGWKRTERQIYLFHLVSSLRINGAVPICPHTTLWRAQGQLYLPLFLTTKFIPVVFRWQEISRSVFLKVCSFDTGKEKYNLSGPEQWIVNTLSRPNLPRIFVIKYRMRQKNVNIFRYSFDELPRIGLQGTKNLGVSVVKCHLMYAFLFFKNYIT